ncbi:MAG: c-type cytochrome biogenesis protein CcsB [Propionibacteriaceae bacterium]|nr:c-type cytochrome biogenesis protein CcsB [Propionibacteriaceae bacterium]
MINLAKFLLDASLVFILLALVTNLVLLSASRRVSRVAAAKTSAKVAVGAGVGGGSLSDTTVVDADVTDADAEAATPPPAKATQKATPLNMASFGTGFTIVGWALLTAYIIVRMAITGHGPFSNMHEFAVAFVWGIMAAYLVAFWKFKVRMLSLIVLPVAACLDFYAISLGVGVETLVPALQNNVLLTLHVGFAMLSYGAACVSFAAAILYLIYPRLKLKMSRDKLDEIGYKSAVVAFPLMTIMILLGALWAKTAWGSYWSWDPKESAALVTWILYAGFMHARVARGWRGTRSAWLLIIGFAAVMVAYFGNYFLGGLHSYR